MTGVPLVVLFALLAPLGVLHAAQAPPIPQPSLTAFVASLQHAVSTNNRQAVAAMLRYPLEVTAGGLQIPVADAAAFANLYDTLMSPGMKQVIARARVPADGKTAPGVVRTSNGGITFENALTIAPSSSSFKVVRLTVPLGATSKPPGEAIERHLTFRVNQPTQVSGTLPPGGRDRFVFYATRGALLDVRLSGVPGRSVLIHILDTATGKPIDARADAGTRVWTGRVGADGNYRIEVVRQPDSGAEPLIYTMAVGVK